jgi:hypothetical protein
MFREALNFSSALSAELIIMYYNLVLHGEPLVSLLRLRRALFAYKLPLFSSNKY